ncbi:MAG: hypothetical protein ABL982_17610 [Vicinamibacterales bacterium]
MATCPECDAEVEVDETDVELGDDVTCPDCGQTLVISNMDPVELDFAPEDDEDEEDDDKEADEDEVDEEDEEEDGADWEEE